MNKNKCSTTDPDSTYATKGGTPARSNNTTTISIQYTPAGGDRRGAWTAALMVR